MNGYISRSPVLVPIKYTVYTRPMYTGSMYTPVSLMFYLRIYNILDDSFSCLEQVSEVHAFYTFYRYHQVLSSSFLFLLTPLTKAISFT